MVSNPALDIPFPVPDYLNESIKEYFDALKYKEFYDCQATELYLALRDAVKYGDISAEQRQTIIDILAREEKNNITKTKEKI